MKVIKRDGSIVEFDETKIIRAIRLSAKRTHKTLSDVEESLIVKATINDLLTRGFKDSAKVDDIHLSVENVLWTLDRDLYSEYRSYNNYKKRFNHSFNNILKNAKNIVYEGDKENANKDSCLNSTKMTLTSELAGKEMYLEYELPKHLSEAHKNMDFYIHDAGHRFYNMINCFGRETRFITNEGVKSFYDFEDGDEVVVPTHNGNWKRAVVKSYGKQKLNKIVLKRGNSKEKIVYATSNHRWILKDGTETTNLKVGDLIYKTPVISDYKWEELSIEDKKLWCLGFAMGDGSYRLDNGYQDVLYIRLCGHKNRYVNRFEDSGFSVTLPECFNGDYKVRMVNYKKEIPWDEINENNVRVFVHGLLCADGHRTENIQGSNKENEFRSIQTTGELNKDLNDLLHMAGYYVSSITDKTNEETNYGKRNGKTLWYRIQNNQTRNSWKVKEITETNREEIVWCLEVEDDKSFILENGLVVGNCCLLDVANIYKGGYKLNGEFIKEPKTIEVALDQLIDIILIASSQQYGGLTIPEIDNLLEPYAQRSFNILMDKYNGNKEKSLNKLYDIMFRCFKRIQFKIKCVINAGGQTSFVTWTFGTNTSELGNLIVKAILDVRKQYMAVFPKLIYLYHSDISGEGRPNHDLYLQSIRCSMTQLYPDYCSAEKGYLKEVYDRCGTIISAMG